MQEGLDILSACYLKGNLPTTLILLVSRLSRHLPWSRPSRCNTPTALLVCQCFLLLRLSPAPISFALGCSPPLLPLAYACPTCFPPFPNILTHFVNLHCHFLFQRSQAILFPVFFTSTPVLLTYSHCLCPLVSSDEFLSTQRKPVSRWTQVCSDSKSWRCERSKPRHHPSNEGKHTFQERLKLQVISAHGSWSLGLALYKYNDRIQPRYQKLHYVIPFLWLSWTCPW